jgi:precorrin-6B methylase 2
LSIHFYDEGEPATGKKVLLATPAYATTSAAYTFAIAKSRAALSAAGIQSAYLILHGNCHVDDGRNSIVRDFLESDCTDLVFLDADVDWETQGLVRLCQHDLDVVGGVYPYRREGVESMPVRMMAGASIAEDGLLEVCGLPTGFMKIKRHVLELMAAAAPKFYDKIYETALVFDRPTPGADKTRWGGDIDFCNRWRAMGGRIFADAELRLGHTTTIIIRDSLGSHLRRVAGATLAHVIPRVRAGVETDADYNEAFKYGNNNFSADPGVLAVVTGVARKCRGPIIEAGSGLSSVFMAAVAPDQKVYSLEHSKQYASQTIAWCEEAGVTNVGICYAPLKDFWYDVDQFDLPKKFALGFCDGPPRMYGTRMQFFEKIAPRCVVVVVDDIKSDNNFAKQVHQWAQANEMTVTILGRAAMLTRANAWAQAA